MNRFLVRLCLPVVVLVPLAASVPADDFKPLVQSDDPAQFQLVGLSADTIAIQDRVIRISGKPNGYFATKDSYKNYVLKFEWMYERPEGLVSDAAFNGNSGLLIHIVGDAKVWPQCVEVQLQNKDAGNTFAINGSKFTGKKDADAQKRAIKPVGQWNVEEVTCKDGAITCTINGIEVAKGTGATPDAGRIGWQSEGAKIQFRNLMIKTLD